jgi:ABC-2 type transport system ATP-binding protein
MKALSIRNLGKTYLDGTVALNGIDLDVEPGDFFALLGPNGAGKSTTIGIVSSLVTKSRGEVSVFGHELHREPALAKAQIGLVPQEINFNVWEPAIEVIVNQAGYYGIDRRLAFERAERYLRQLGLWEKRRSQGKELSGGMKRRLMIARALVHEPRLLILDEPTAGVDIEIRRSMWAFLRRINEEGTTIILTTHYLEEAESLCRNIAIIDRGRIVENSSMKALLGKLSLETFVLYLREPLRDPQVIARHHVRVIDDTTVEVDVSQEDSISDVFAWLRTHGMDVVSMRNKRNRLEELFLSLVQANDPNTAQRETAAA